MHDGLQSVAERANAPRNASRNGTLTIRELADEYIADHRGRDPALLYRLSGRCARIGDTTLADITDDHVHDALEQLAQCPGRYWAGTDADGAPIMEAKRGKPAPATVNRYAASLGGMLTWAIGKRIAPRGVEHPCRGVERRSETSERVRFLAPDERARLLEATRASRWPRLYLLVLMAITTGARRGELMGLRARALDLARAVAHVHLTKNGDRKVLPLMPAVVEEWASVCIASRGIPGTAPTAPKPAARRRHPLHGRCPRPRRAPRPATTALRFMRSADGAP